MAKDANELNWTEIMNKFAVYKGPMIDFCRENNIKHYQLYYQRKKLNKEMAQTFHAIELKKDVPAEKKSSYQIYKPKTGRN